MLKNVTAYSDFSVYDFIDAKNGISFYLIVPYNHIRITCKLLLTVFCKTVALLLSAHPCAQAIGRVSASENKRSA
ncbi:hypothetical protein [Treponema pectinovorum]|uniref:hypothetical protein n=1 Tax=Treponema pectinovorum TaxID=164 RepID=UPI0021C43038|nr:hypothetical protein [Treponema pectinovorum]